MNAMVVITLTAFQTSYNKDLPPGYTFLAVGTPELAEFCKELSRKRNLPVNVVNVCLPFTIFVRATKAGADLFSRRLL